MGLFDIFTKRERERERERAEEQALIEEEKRINALVWSLISDRKWDEAIQVVETRYDDEDVKRTLLRAIGTKKKEIEDREFREKWEYFSFRVAGVTFKNTDGKNRQTYLRKIKFRDPPFDKKLVVSMTEGEYKGSPTLSVTVNDCQVGFVPQELVQKLLDSWDRIDKITAFQVIGGGNDDDGYALNYGAEVYLRFHRVKNNDL